MNSRSKRLLIFFAALLGVIVSFTLLVSASPVLLWSLSPDYNLPLGTFITWLGMIALPVSILTGIPKLYSPSRKWQRGFRFLMISAIVLAGSWGFISFFLAGNWSFSFRASSPGFRGSPGAGEVFWVINYVILAAPVTLLMGYGVFWLVDGLRSKNRIR